MQRIRIEQLNVTLSLGIALLAALLPLTAAAEFSDVPATHANYDAIVYVQEKAIVDGYDDDTYRPDQTINRAEFTKILVRSKLGHPALDFSASCFAEGSTFPDGFVFSDVDAELSWFAVDVCAAYELQLISGYPDGTFGPSGNINFAEAAKIIAKSFDLPNAETDTWYEGFVRALAEKRAIPDTVASFEYQITRGEMAEMIYRLQTANTIKSSRTYEDLLAAPPKPVANPPRTEKDLRLTSDGVSESGAREGDAGYVLPYIAWMPDAERMTFIRQTYGDDCMRRVCREDAVRYDFRNRDGSSMAAPGQPDADGWILSPDETQALQVVNTWTKDPKAELGQISLKDLKTGRVRLLGKCTYKTGADNAYTSNCFDFPVWSPDGLFIAMQDARTWGNVVILRADANSYRDATVIGKSELLESEVSGPYLFWSPDSGKLLAHHEYAIFTIPDGRELYRDSNERPWNIYGDWRWSPDSTRLLFTRSLAGRGGEVVTMNADGSDEQVIYSSAAVAHYNLSADWSHDGTRVAVSNGTSLFLVDVAAKTTRTLSSDGIQYGYVRWSPNGRRIAYIKDGDVWVYEL